MDTTDSRGVVTEFIARCNSACQGGKTDPYVLLDKDTRLWVNGSTSLSGDFVNLDCIRNVLVPTAKDRIHSLNVSIDEFVGSGSRLAAVLTITGKSIDGRTYNEERKPSGAVFTVANGKIREIRLYPNTMQIETVLYHRSFVTNCWDRQ